MAEQPSPPAGSPLDGGNHRYKEPLSPAARRGLLAAVIFFHVGGGWALTLVEPTRLVVGDVAPMEVSFVAAPQPAPPQLEPPEPEPSPPEPPPPEPEPPPELESMIQPPMPDLPPPVFPVEAPPPKPTPKPKPPPKPKPKPRQAAPAPPKEAPPQPAAAPARQAGPRTVTDAQVGYLDRPSPIYPARSRRANEQGVVVVRVLVDPTGRPSQVTVQKSSGHAALDASALSALRAARFRPFIDGGVAQPVWVLAPVNFSLQ